MSNVRIGLIGSGFMGRTSAETITRYLKHATLVAVTGGSRAAALAQEYSIESEPSVDALVQRKDIDAVMISTPHAMHAEQAVAAASAGKHILIDKPMATTVEECDRILDAARASAVKVMIMFGQRFRTCNLAAHRLIQEGAIGSVRMIQEQLLASGGLSSLAPWQSLSENWGIFLGHAVHNIDRIRWMTGAEVASVSAHMQRDPVSGNEVSTMALLSMNNGVMATIWASWAIQDPIFKGSASGALISGDKGNLELDAYGQLRLGKQQRWTVMAEQEPINWAGDGMLSSVRLKAYQMQHQEFVDSILEDRSPSITGEDGLAAVEVAAAAYRSAAEGRSIQLRPVGVAQ